MLTMNDRMLVLIQRRGELLASIAAQREQVSEIGTQLKGPLALADQGWAAARFLRSNPILVAGVVALIAIRRRSVAGLVKGAWRVWRGYRRLRDFSEKLSPPP